MQASSALTDNRKQEKVAVVPGAPCVGDSVVHGLKYMVVTWRCGVKATILNIQYSSRTDSSCMLTLLKLIRQWRDSKW